MSVHSAPVTILAPRELKDLVYRCCRVEGIDSGAAERFADNLLHAQIHRGESVETFLSILASSSSSTNDLTRVVTAADRVELAEATARSEGVATATFDSAVPLLALSLSLWHAAQRGISSMGVSVTAPGDQHVESIELVTGALDQTTRTSAQQRYSTAHRQGLSVATSAFVQLESHAASFLVAETKLDAVEP